MPWKRRWRFGILVFSLSGVVKKGGIGCWGNTGRSSSQPTRRSGTESPSPLTGLAVLWDAQWDGHWSPTLWLHYWRRLSSPVMTCGWQTAPVPGRPLPKCKPLGQRACPPALHQAREPVEVRASYLRANTSWRAKEAPGRVGDGVLPLAVKHRRRIRQWPSPSPNLKSPPLV